jgi:hypothetical protein
MFNTCSWGPTHRSLTDTGRAYNLGGTGLPHHTPRPSQPTVLRFSPNGPVRSQVNQPIITNWIKEETNTKSCEWDPPLDFYYNLASRHELMILHQVIGLTRLNKKVDLNATTTPYNSYKLNAHSTRTYIKDLN